MSYAVNIAHPCVNWTTVVRITHMMITDGVYNGPLMCNMD